MNEETVYVSGLGNDSKVPPEINKWNWGAFFLNWIWGIGNSTYIAFLMFVPLVNFIMLFVLGAKGSKWAWQKRTWRDVDHFKAVQKKWAISGLVLWGVIIPIMVFTIGGVFKGNDAYKLSLATVQNNQELIDIIGSPIEAGFFVTGSMQTSGPNGQAALKYAVEGPYGSADTYVFASKEIEKWVINQLVVHFPDTNKRIDIITP